MPKTRNLEPFNVTLKNFEHYKSHIDDIKNQYDDLVVNRLDNGSFLFLSKKIAPLADDVDFYSESIYPVNIHYAQPFKEITTLCKYCNEEKSIYTIRIGTIPDRIPIMTDYVSGGEGFLYTCSFEDSMEQMGLTKNIVGKSRLYVIEYLKEKEKNLAKAYEVFVNSSINKIMVFS